LLVAAVEAITKPVAVVLVVLDALLMQQVAVEH
jgi:hypothetical protein